ncbi:MAG: von Willebrand factor type A domain-containing protein [Labilithrix sp.]|nr:von Willebrand factor type A domain-containing protein [Labilithrix sp.]
MRALRPSFLLPSLFLVGAVACGDSSDSTLSSARAIGGSAEPGGSAFAPGGAGAGETYGKLVENDWIETAKEPISTFGVDVDTGSYSLMRRDVRANRLPDPDSVRVEEYINYFRYDYAPPQDDRPFAVHLDGAPSPFGDGLHLIRVGMQSKVVDPAQRKPANLVFLVDVSGSMSAPDKLPLVQAMLKSLVTKLTDADTLSIVTYAGYENVLLPPARVSDKAKILAAIDGLHAGGGTNGEGGIRKAYELAEQVKQQQQVESINRVIMCTDGDFNVGLTGDALVELIEEEREKNITLSTFGFGQGNYNARDMEALAQKGNGNYAYIDAPEEIDRFVQKRLVATLQVIAKDTKIQIDLDPTFVQRYRLVGYENRVLNKEDFADDTKDSGDLGAGHSVTAFYEVELTEAAKSGQLATGNVANVKLRWKPAEGDVSTEAAVPFPASKIVPSFETASEDFRFAAATVEYAEILRRSKHSEGARFDDVIATLSATSKQDPDRLQLVELARSAKPLWR